MSPPIGTCALCLRTRELRDSHFMPKALYRLIRANNHRNPHPVRATARGRKQTAFQARTYLLCVECEARFDKNGEDYVMRQCYRGRGRFRLRETVEKLTAAPDSTSEFALYAASQAPEVNIEKLAYFATSVFWRASVRSWVVEGEEYEGISLGKKYAEEFRQYLLGDAPFPENATVGVLLSKLRFPALGFLFPVTVRVDEGWCHRLHIPGITFLLTIGRHSPESKSVCFLRSPAHPIAISTHGDARVQKDVLRLLGKVAPPWGEYPLIEGFESQRPLD